MKLDVKTLLDDRVRWWEIAGHDQASLRESWITLLYALQAVAEPGRLFAEPRDDGTHATMQWYDGARILDGFLAGELVETSHGPFRAALRLVDMVLFLIKPDGEAIAESPLENMTLDRALVWIAESAMNSMDIDVKQASPIAEPLPHHPIADGATFGGRPQLAQVELIRLYANTAALLIAARARHPEISHPRCWPQDGSLRSSIELPDRAASLTAGLAMEPQSDHAHAGAWFVRLLGLNPNDDAPLARLHADTPDITWQPIDVGGWEARLPLGTLHDIEDAAIQKNMVVTFMTSAINAAARACTPEDAAPQHDAASDDPGSEAT